MGKTTYVRKNMVKEIAQSFSEKNPQVKQWLAKLQSKERNSFNLYRFCQWARKTPTQLLALKENPASKEAEFLLDRFVADDKTGFKDSVKFVIINSVKSFFKHNYCDLSRACGVISLVKVRPYNKPSKENLRKLWTWALNPRDKSIITFICSTSVCKETLLRLKWKHLEENWEKADLPCVNIPGELLKGHNIGRYRGVRQITFLTPEAKRDLINYREWIEAKLHRKLGPEDNIFLETYAPYPPMKYGRLGTLIWRLSREAGVPFSAHDARRHVQTCLEEVRTSENWIRKIKGRKCRGEEAPYSQPAIEQLREKFREAAPLLEFTSERPPQVPKEVLERIEALEKERAQIRKEWRLRKAENIEIPPPPQTNEEEDCGEDFKQINETELLQYLKDGWAIEYRLSDGKVIIKR